MFLIEAQNRFVKDELALSRITVVVAIIHLEALIRCGDLLGSVDIRVDHVALALKVIVMGIRLGLRIAIFLPAHMRSAYFATFLLGKMKSKDHCGSGLCFSSCPRCSHRW